jgi:hypothetical protein
MTTLRCPTCGVTFDASHIGTRPFCSKRCQQIDLGRWLGEQMGLPHVPDPEDDEEAPPGNGHPPAERD